MDAALSEDSRIAGDGYSEELTLRQPTSRARWLRARGCGQAAHI